MDAQTDSPGGVPQDRGALKLLLWVVALVFIVAVPVGVLVLYKVFTWTQPWPVLTQMPLNLVEFLNNDGVCWEKNRADTNFDCPDHPAHIPGAGYAAEELPATGEVFACRALPGVHFVFPPTEDGAKNNVACSGQAVEFPPTRCEKLFVLGAAENGKREAELALVYEDSDEKVPLRFSDWCEPAQFGEVVGFHFAHRFGWDARKNAMAEEKIPCSIWVQELRVQRDRKLKKIQLPYDQRLHVFAMTLAVRTGEISHLGYSQETARIYKEQLEGNAPTFMALQQKQEGLRSLLEETAAEQNGPLRRECCWAQSNLDYIQTMIPAPPYKGARSSIKTIQQLQADVEADIRELHAGRNPFPDKRGVMLKAARSGIDGSLEPYWLSVPAEYKGDKPFPLVVSLHGHGGWGVFLGKISGTSADRITVSPHGRGSMDYFFVAEDSVLSAIREVQQDYRIDLDRVYMTGGSMGGTGSWALGVRFPDIFAAIVPNSGNSNHRVWMKEWGWNWGWGEPSAAAPFPVEQIGRFAQEMFSPKQDYPTPGSFTSLGEFISDEIDPITYAENLADLPAYAGHGAKDEVVPVGHARTMTDKLKSLGYNVLYDEDPEAGHSVPGAICKKQQEWMFKQRRNARPKVVRYRTNRLRYPGAYWLAINKFLRRCRFGEIEGKVDDAGTMEIRTSNVADFSVDLAQCPAPGKIKVAIDGAPSYDGSQPKSKLLTFHRRGDGTWASTERPVGSGKRATVEGPIEDLLMSPFMLVYGTTANTEAERLTIASEADVFARDWDRLYHAKCRIKPDVEVTPEDIEKYNLILYGRPTANLITARVADKLPIRIEGKRIVFGKDSFEGDDLGVKFCYPNPLNPGRCVAVFAATTWQGMIGINTRFGNWFMWGPYDNRNWFDYGVFDGRTRSPDTFLLVGFFDDDWKRSPETEWRGDPVARRKSLPRTIPKYKEPPVGTTEMYLTDLMPVFTDQHKGPINFDRSFKGNDVSIGKKAYKRGLGVRPQSVVEFVIAGRFDRFSVEAGGCLEGLAEFPAARKKNENLQFIVYGDGRQLCRTDWIKCDAPPQLLEADVKNVTRLKLECRGGGPMWHFGSCAWGDPKLVKTP